MKNVKWLLSLSTWFLLLNACSVSPTPQSRAITALTPYVIETPVISTPQPTETMPTDLPSPSPTPFYYRVQAGDTISAIALRYGVELAAVLAANPGVNPNAISTGSEILIPPRAQSNLPAGSASIVPIQISQPVCYPEASGGLWCFVLLSNQTQEAAEGIVFKIIIGNTDASQLSEQSAPTLLNSMRAGAELPSVVYFPAPVLKPQRADASIVSALPLKDIDQRYPATTILEQNIAIDQGGKLANVSGKIRLADAQASAGSVWVLAAAFDEQDNLIGVRRWVSSTGLQAGQELQFTFSVYASASHIASVSLYTEAQK